MKNFLKFVGSAALLSSGSVSNITFNKNKNDTVTSDIEYSHNSTGTNYTSPLQAIELQRYISQNNHNYINHYDPTKHTHEQNLKALQKSIHIRIKEAKQKLDQHPGSTKEILIHEFNDYILKLAKNKKHGPHLKIEIKENALTKNVKSWKDIWHWTCFHTLHFTIGKTVGFNTIDYLSINSLALVISKKIFNQVFTGFIAGQIVSFIWEEIAKKHVGTFANHAANHMCGTHYNKVNQSTLNKKENRNRQLLNKKNNKIKQKV